MASHSKAVGPALVTDETATRKAKPSKTLPFDRVALAKQLEILRAYAAASAQGTKLVTNSEVASIVGLVAETVSMCNGFLSSIGFIQKSENGWIVSAEVQAFFRAYDWNKESAAQKLAPLLESSWAGQAILPKLSFRPMEEDEAIGQLADAATAGPDYRRNLKMIVDFMEAAAIVQRDGSMLRKRIVTASEGAQSPQTQLPKADSKETTPEQVPQGLRPKVATTFSQMAQGTMRFNVSFDVDLTEMANWRADRIAAFFSGIAQVLAAKAEVEKTAGT
ncbi:MAG TPA: hypothetical protein VFA04_26260 [Bryobacteraceae bacterium]|nr:hypothetical protein [Bryobacteraceae bacterium]